MILSCFEKRIKTPQILDLLCPRFGVHIKSGGFFIGSLSNRIGEELLGEALTVVTQLMLLFDLREKYNQCD